MAAALIEVDGVTRRFGGLVAVRDVNLEVPPQTIMGIIGPNGAGKTTLFNLISGADRPTSGQVRYSGEISRRHEAHEIASRFRVARTFQNLRLFGGMTAQQNVMVGRYARTRAGYVASVLKSPLARREQRESSAIALELLALVGLEREADERAGALPYGGQRRVEIARALASEPTCLLLDEPAAGMTGRETDDLAPLLESIRDRGIAILMIEHKMHLVMGTCERVAVLNFGQLVTTGTPTEVQAHPEVVRAYLGGAAANA